ncbi:MAG: NfeD family protein [Burkholderiaceae bacterium]|jgi:membrane protein implicated in regulation of membrane protease activity
MSLTLFWWLLAGILVAVELASGTFYLLMLAVGAAAGALVAMLTDDLVVQTLVAGTVGLAACLAWKFFVGHGRKPAAQISFDIGQTVDVDVWRGDGTADVKYRGAPWRAVSIDAVPQTGCHIIAQVDGARLKLTKKET